MLYEVYKQLQGKAGPRQIKNPRRGLTHNLGGYPAGLMISVIIAGKDNICPLYFSLYGEPEKNLPPPQTG